MARCLQNQHVRCGEGGDPTTSTSGQNNARKLTQKFNFKGTSLQPPNGKWMAAYESTWDPPGGQIKTHTIKGTSIPPRDVHSTQTNSAVVLPAAKGRRCPATSGESNSTFFAETRLRAWLAGKLRSACSGVYGDPSFGITFDGTKWHAKHQGGP